MRIFIIGNSFSGNATRYLPQLAEEGEHQLEIGHAEIGGCSLERHWNAIAASANGDDNADRYDGKSLRELLQAGEWDLVTMQQASILSASVSSYQPYANQLHDFVKTLAPNAEVILHQTWAYRVDSPFFSEIGEGQSAQKQREMYEKSREAYHTIASEMGLRLIPTGDAFWIADNDPNWKYQPDTSFDFEHPVFPNLPDQTNSLYVGYHWNEDGQLIIDPKHATPAGEYLGALVWYGFLFGESPEKLTFAPEELSAPFAAHLRSVAAQALQTSINPEKP